MPLYTWIGKLLTAGGKLAVGQECCCSTSTSSSSSSSSGSPSDSSSSGGPFIFRWNKYVNTKPTDNKE